MYRVILAALFLTANSAMAFDVSVFNSPTDPDDVVIQGDGDPNEVVIETVRENVIRVTPRRTGPFNVFPTLINGRSGSIEITVRDNLFISMAGGNDTVTIRDLTLNGGRTSDLNILLGSGSDDLLIESIFVSGAVAIDAGSGHDDLRIYSVNAGEFLFSCGSGDDYLDMGLCNARDFQCDGGTGDELMFFMQNSVGNITFSLEAGDDTLFMYSNGADEVSLFGGSGTDTLGTTIWAPNSFDPHPNSRGFERHPAFMLGV